MNNNVHFSEVQLLNLSALLTIRDCVQHDLIAACCKFGLSSDQAHFISRLSVDEILVTVLHLGHECMLVPRQDLVSLLALPAPLAGPIASVHPPHKTTSSH